MTNQNLLWTMLVAGVLGGIVNYFYYPNEKGKTIFIFFDYNLLRSIFTGVVASFLVPLFLNMISSNIMQEAARDELKLSIFFGFCLIAAIASKTFIETLSERLLNEVRKVERKVDNVVEKKINPIVEKQSEPEQFSNNGENDIAELKSSAGTEPDESNMPDVFEERDGNKVKVLKAIGYGRYTFRTLNGVCQDTALSAEEVNSCLNDLISEEYIGQNISGEGLKFYITGKGRAQLKWYKKTAYSHLLFK